ncbi:MAG: hypothetical protein EOO67_03250 [Microbacterium sp.]|nr:MAG: hypothetical protein EOO67_03250 [Microbacterium sp.]
MSLLTDMPRRVVRGSGASTSVRDDDLSLIDMLLGLPTLDDILRTLGQRWRTDVVLRAVDGTVISIGRGVRALVADRGPAPSGPAAHMTATAGTPALQRADVFVDGDLLAYAETAAVVDGALLRMVSRVLATVLARAVDRRVDRRERLADALRALDDRATVDRDICTQLRLLGMNGDDPVAVVVACAPGGIPVRVRSACLLREICGAFDTEIDEHLVFLVPGADPVAAGKRIRDALRRIAPVAWAVGVGAPGAGVASLRNSFAEGRRAAQRGAGVHIAEPISLIDALLSTRGAALVDSADHLLASLVRSDRERGTELVTTLRALLDEDFSLVRTAARLIVHQNTVKYRMAQIRELSGLDLSCTADRAQVWIAMSILADVEA